MPSMPSTTHRRRAAAVPLAAALLVLPLASCSGDDSATSTTSTIETEATASTTVASGDDVTTTAPSGDDATPAIVAAATAFLDSLTADERDAVLFDLDDTEQRQRWSNLPEGLFSRDGLMWGDLDEDSQEAWLGVLRSILSDEGYEQVLGEWGADDQLAGGDYGREYYWVAIIGEPSETDAWQFQFGGHHVTVNATIQGADVSVTPSFIGVQPALYDENGAEVRPLGSIEDDAYALLASLDDAQLDEAVLGDQLIDLVAGPGEDGTTVEAQGVSGADLSEEQQQLLLTLIGHYGNLVNEEDATSRMAQLEADLDQTSFAWYGPTDPADTSGIYFRVTGPHILVEYSGQQMGGDATDHIHGIYRDPTNDYGEAFGAGLS